MDMGSSDSMSASASMAMTTGMPTASMTPTSTAGMSMSTGMSMDDMSMGAGECKISMLWNWYTVDSCKYRWSLLTLSTPSKIILSDDGFLRHNYLSRFQCFLPAYTTRKWEHFWLEQASSVATGTSRPTACSPAHASASFASSLCLSSFAEFSVSMIISSCRNRPRLWEQETDILAREQTRPQMRAIQNHHPWRPKIGQMEDRE